MSESPIHFLQKYVMAWFEPIRTRYIVSLKPNELFVRNNAITYNMTTLSLILEHKFVHVNIIGSSFLT